MRDILIISLVGSFVLTVVLNTLPKAFPGAAKRAEQAVHRQLDRMQPSGGSGGGGTKVVFPWKAMIIVSVGLTILINVIGALAG